MNLSGPHYYGTVKGRALLRTGLDAAGLACMTETERIPPGLLAHGPIDHVCVSEPLCHAARVAGAWEGKDGDGIRLSDHSGVAVEVGS
jgi:endonuclease/exonuclease/phosphatase family metal-dependent hydrolase